MMALRTRCGAAAGMLTAAALLLTACGGGDHGQKIASNPAPNAPTAPPTTARPTASPGGPVFDFPSDVKVVIDPDTTGDATKDAVLRDQAYAEEATYMAIVQLDPELPLFTKYVTADAQANWSNNIASGKKIHHTITGTVHIYDRKVTLTSASRAGITFCEDQRYSYDKDTKTGKALETTPSAGSFIFHTSLLVKAEDGTWQTASYNSQRAAARCQP